MAEATKQRTWRSGVRLRTAVAFGVAVALTDHILTQLFGDFVPSYIWGVVGGTACLAYLVVPMFLPSNGRIAGQASLLPARPDDRTTK